MLLGEADRDENGGKMVASYGGVSGARKRPSGRPQTRTARLT
jgi:hypothetical protein